MKKFVVFFVAVLVAATFASAVDLRESLPVQYAAPGENVISFVGLGPSAVTLYAPNSGAFWVERSIRNRTGSIDDVPIPCEGGNSYNFVGPIDTLFVYAHDDTVFALGWK